MSFESQISTWNLFMFSPLINQLRFKKKTKASAEKNWPPHFQDPCWIPPFFILTFTEFISWKKISAID